jgi:hypothetical protein
MTTIQSERRKAELSTPSGSATEILKAIKEGRQHISGGMDKAQRNQNRNRKKRSKRFPRSSPQVETVAEDDDEEEEEVAKPRHCESLPWKKKKRHSRSGVQKQNSPTFFYPGEASVPWSNRPRHQSI